MGCTPFFFVIMQRELIKFLENFISDRRRKLFDSILDNRTDYISVVLEDIFQSHNASAVLRTCDCFGIQNVNIIENLNTYDVNPDVALGSDKWLSMRKFNKKDFNTPEAYECLRKEGYRIVATTPHANDTTLDEFDLEKGKVALVFGTELKGLSSVAIGNADEYLKIPMFGFTESFNISVSAAIILNHLTGILRESSMNWKLTDDAKTIIKLEWLKRSIKSSDLLEKKYLSGNNI